MRNIIQKTIVMILIIFLILVSLNISKSKESTILRKNTITEKNFDIDINQNKKIAPIGQEYISGELIVKIKSDLPIEDTSSFNGQRKLGIFTLDILNSKNNVLSIENVFKNKENQISISKEFDNIYKFTFQKNMNIFSIAKKYEKNPNIIYAEPNYIHHFCNVPNDPYFSQQWSLNQLSDHDIDGSEAWDIETGRSNVTIAIIDMGVDYNHPDLKNNIWVNENEIPNNGIDDDENGFIDDVNGWDFYTNTNNPIDLGGHGTLCAGIASSVTNNNIGIAGVSWNSKIMPLKVHSLPISTIEQEARAIIYAADNGADIISMSFGGFYDSKVLRDAVNYAYSKGVFLVAAAGNNNHNNKFYPAAFDNVFSVAATDENDKKADFSNYGSWIDVAAPGVNILSLRANNTSLGNIIDDKYTFVNGTSFAGPHVAGLVALLLSKNNSLNQNMIKTMLCNTADKINTDKYIGTGRINAYKALSSDPVEAVLKSFSDGSDVKGVIPIIGSASGKNFQAYKVEYGRGKNPNNYIELNFSTNKVHNDVLAYLNTTILDDGYFTIKLNVSCNYTNYEDSTYIVVNNKYNRFTVDNDGLEANYSSIQDALDDAGNNDEIFVYSGEYNESIKICRSVNVIGENKSSTIIRLKGYPKYYFLPLVNIKADNVTINGFTIMDSGYGIVTYSFADHCKIFNNIFEENFIDIAIQSSCCQISNNKMTNEIILFYAFNNSIWNNSLYNGINISMSNNNIIHDNKISEGSKGIEICLSNNNKIYNNSIFDNVCGIKIFENSNNNVIYHNEFINNSENANDCSVNSWDNGYPSGGNYWDDYTGIDGDNDGIGDAPYNIPGGNNKDLYPLISLEIDLNPPSISIMKPEKAFYLFNMKIRNYMIRKPLIVGKINITANAIDKESKINRVEFYIDKDLKYTDCSYPYNYLWKRDKIRFFKHKHDVKVIAYDTAGNNESKEIKVWKFL